MCNLHKLQLFYGFGNFMFKIYPLILCLVIFAKPSLADNSIVVQSTTSTYNSGFYDYILPLLKSETNVTAHVVSVGTGAALKNAANCDGDVIIVHAKNRELEFVKNGNGVNRQNLMYNDFVIIGSKRNPAKININDNPIKAFIKIYNSSSVFVSRGDDSGTHFKEMSIWRKANLDPTQFSGGWYRETGSGMGTTLNLASGMEAYTLTDRASWIKFNNKKNLDVIAEKDKLLFNQYGITMVNPLKCPNVRLKNTKIFINWLLSEKGQKAIKNFKIKGQQLFFPNAN
jgi:tungstate transport system substrate-binding protein